MVKNVSDEDDNDSHKMRYVDIDATVPIIIVECNDYDTDDYE